MQGNQEREPLAGQQPIPLIQILPDGRLAYVTLPMASLPQAPQQSCVVKTMGILMLMLALFGLVTRVCMAHKMKRKPQWALWGIGLGVCTLMLITAVLGIRAGAKKTSRAAMCYMRFLVFFAVIFVIALVVESMLFIKIGTKHWKNRNSHWNQSSDFNDKDEMPAMDAPMPCDIPPQPAGPVDPSVTTTEATRPSDFPPPPDSEMQPESAETYPEFDTIEERAKRGKKDKYGDRDEHRWTKEEVKEGMMLGMFVMVLLSMGLCCSCVFCALRLTKYSKSYEALFPHDGAVPQFNYVHHQPMQPMQPMQMQPMQSQPQVELHHFQSAAPQVVQAVPLGQAGLYPNLAPIGSAVQYPRSS